MKKLSIEQMENVNGGGACTLILQATLAAEHEGKHGLANLLFLVWRDECTALW